MIVFSSCANKLTDKGIDNDGTRQGSNGRALIGRAVIEKGLAMGTKSMTPK